MAIELRRTMTTLPIAPEVPTERTAIVVWLISKGRTFKTSEVAELVGINRSSAYDVMARISRVLPITMVDGVWMSISHDD